MKEAGNRQAERQALHGGHVHQRVPSAHWSGRAEQPPLLDEESTRYPKRRDRKARKAKERCSANPDGHTHEWMKDTEEVPIVKNSWIQERYGPEMAEFLGRDYYTRYKTEVVGHVTQQYRLCAHCGKTQIRRNGGWRTPTYYDTFREKFRFRGRTYIQ